MTYEFYDLGHLDLREDTSRPVLSEVARVADCERVRPLDSNLAGLAAIELGHALHLSESNKVAILEAVSRLV